LATLTLNGQETALERGKSLFDYADALGVRLPQSCNRNGRCHECIVDVRRGMDALSEKTEAEAFLQGNFRLACQARVTSTETDIELVPLLRSHPQILTEARHRPVKVDPLTQRRDGVVQFKGEDQARFEGRLLGLAIDAGTSTVVLNLLDLESGEEVATACLENPQIFGGSDVMHRVRYDGEVGGGELKRALLSALNRVIKDLPCQTEEIWEVTVVGNPTMRDLFFGLDVQPIGQRPFKSVIEQERDEGRREGTFLWESAKDLGLTVNPHARVYGLPLVGCHVGADTAACMSSISLWDEPDLVMLMDIGTNTEVVLGNRDRVVAASCPAGPAFEGWGVKHGMPGLEGAIETVRIRNGRVEYQTIGAAPPRGICGSGLIDLLAELLRVESMTPLGRFTDGNGYFEIVSDEQIRIYESDISALAQAKGANTAGERLLMEYFGVTPKDLKCVYLAGGFANYIDPANAIAIGLVPEIPLEKIVKIGNAAVEGATEVLLNQQTRSTLEAFVSQVEHVELETRPHFFDVFVEGVQFRPWK
jgi:uncharacterized 2Fe-2S/4Fe-4S cluster protein (DUF4445 family)